MINGILTIILIKPELTYFLWKLTNTGIYAGD